MTLTELKICYRMGETISFDISDHPRIPNVVLINGSVVSKVSKSTIKAFNNWLIKEMK